MSSDGVLAGQSAIVTAGASGIGRAIAECLIAAGAAVHICDVSYEHLNTAKTSVSGLTGSLADVSKPAEVEQLFDDALAQMGGLDILVNNAGIQWPGRGKTGLEHDEQIWWDILAVNL
ncbi:MAG: SDR family NAD(P)-dependent oxidoreductase, partial [Rhodospirillales bacterium]|nr:SDR family NAD(P)-dependent oxidoreductase [Rhodospirillales bacterium]